MDACHVPVDGITTSEKVFADEETYAFDVQIWYRKYAVEVEEATSTAIRRFRCYYTDKPFLEQVEWSQVGGQGWRTPDCNAIRKQWKHLSVVDAIQKFLAVKILFCMTDLLYDRLNAAYSHCDRCVVAELSSVCL